MLRLCCRAIAVGIVVLAAAPMTFRPGVAQTPEVLEARRFLAVREPVLLQTIETWKRSGEPNAATMVAKYTQELNEIRRAAQLNQPTTKADDLKCDRNDPANAFDCEFFKKR